MGNGAGGTEANHGNHSYIRNYVQVADSSAISCYIHARILIDPVRWMPMKINRPKNKTGKITKARIIRAVASSTAIETGKPVRTIEAKLKSKNSKFELLTLSS
jgi:hypothetical protein